MRASLIPTTTQHCRHLLPVHGEGLVLDLSAIHLINHTFTDLPVLLTTQQIIAQSQFSFYSPGDAVSCNLQ